LVVGEEHPCLAGFFEDIVVIFVDRVGELVAAQILPDVFARVELGCVGRLVNKCDVAGYGEAGGEMISSAVENKGCGRVPRLAQTRVSVPCWPMRASSWNQISSGFPLV